MAKKCQLICSSVQYFSTLPVELTVSRFLHFPQLNNLYDGHGLGFPIVAVGISTYLVRSTYKTRAPCVIPYKFTHYKQTNTCHNTHNIT